jgi:hypothetical protein
MRGRSLFCALYSKIPDPKSKVGNLDERQCESIQNPQSAIQNLERWREVSKIPNPQSKIAWRPMIDEHH